MKGRQTEGHNSDRGIEERELEILEGFSCSCFLGVSSTTGGAPRAAQAAVPAVLKPVWPFQVCGGGAEKKDYEGQKHPGMRGHGSPTREMPEGHVPAWPSREQHSLGAAVSRELQIRQKQLKNGAGSHLWSISLCLQCPSPALSSPRQHRLCA